MAVRRPPYPIQEPYQSCADHKQKASAECSCQVQVQLLMLHIKGQLAHHDRQKNPDAQSYPAQQELQEQELLQGHRWRKWDEHIEITGRQAHTAP